MRDEKREYTTKRVFVSAKYFLTTLAIDEDTVYPVTLSILTQNGGSTISLHSRDEVFDTIISPFVLECGVVKALRKADGKTFVDIQKGGMMTIPKTTLPYTRHNTTLVAGQVSELYDSIFGKE